MLKLLKLQAPTWWITAFIKQGHSLFYNSVTLCHLGPKQFCLFPESVISLNKTTQSAVGFSPVTTEAYSWHLEPGTENR